MKHYEKLKEKLSLISAMENIQEKLSWDESTYMPDGAVDALANQMGALAVQISGVYTSKEFKALVNASEKEISKTGSDWDKANVAQAKRKSIIYGSLPKDLIKELAVATANSQSKWQEARKKSDFSIFLPEFERMFELTRQKGKILGEKLGMEPYDALMQEFQPGLTTKDIAPIFDDLKVFIPSFMAEVEKKQKDSKIVSFAKGYDIAKQEVLNKKFAQMVGFDFNRGRLDVSAHPMTCGSDPRDVRITTSYDEKDPVDTLLSTIHEAGHAIYEQNIPIEQSHLPAGSNAGMAAHESISLLTECCFGRSKECANYIAEEMQKVFGKDDPALTPENIYNRLNKQERGMIRTRAGEVTYPLHVIMRYEMEKDLINGKLACKDVPKVWNQKMKDYIGITPKNDAEGCLQDVHWSAGLIAYFPAYSMGAMAAAQMLETIKQREPDVMEKMAKGDMKALQKFVKEEISARGAKLGFAALVAAATGKPLTAEAYKKYLRNRYLGDNNNKSNQVFNKLANDKMIRS